MVPIILFMFYSNSIHWSIWPSVILCVAGVYLLSDFTNATVRLGDSLVILCAVFWSLHIIFIGKFIEKFNLPLFFGSLQAILFYFRKDIFDFRKNLNLFYKIAISTMPLKVSGPILSIPVSWAIKVVPQIKVQNKALNNESVFDIK